MYETAKLKIILKQYWDVMNNLQLLSSECRDKEHYAFSLSLEHLGGIMEDEKDAILSCVDNLEKFEAEASVQRRKYEDINARLDIANAQMDAIIKKEQQKINPINAPQQGMKEMEKPQQGTDVKGAEQAQQNPNEQDKQDE